MLSSSHPKIHEPPVTGVSPPGTAKHEETCGCREPCRGL
jgi:hypothetical protein